MQDYGIIQGGKLIVVNDQREGYKQVEYASIPDTFDQITQYAIQTPPVDTGDNIIVGIEIKELPPQDGQQSDIL